MGRVVEGIIEKYIRRPVYISPGVFVLKNTPDIFCKGGDIKKW